MIFEGSFVDINNNYVYDVKIGNRGATKEIQDNDQNFLTPDEIVCFGPSPVKISSDMSDTFENVYIRSCSINLISNYDLRPYVVADNYTDIPVVIKMADYEDKDTDPSNWSIVFDGFVNPLSFNQPFALKWNEFTLECCDRLGILEYKYLYNLLNSNYNYNTPRHFLELALSVCGFSTQSNNLQYNIQYDHTQDTYINPVIFVGDDLSNQDDWMTCKEVVEEIGKIYGFAVWQDGDVCHVGTVLLKDLSNPYTVQKEDYTGRDTNISIDNAYNKITCTVDISSIDETFIDPFKKEYFSSVSDKPMRILTEMYVDAEDDSGIVLNAFRAYSESCQRIVNWHEQIGSASGIVPEIYDHYAQIMKNEFWDFGDNSYLTDGGGEDPTKDVKYTLDWLKDNPGKGAFIATAHTDNVVNQQNKANISYGDLKTALVIQVGGHDPQTAQEITTEKSRLQSQLQANNPICTFHLNKASSLVPNDKSTTNYLVINGNITLNPLQPKTGVTQSNNYLSSRNTIGECISLWNSLDWTNIWRYNAGSTLYGKTVTVKDKDAYYQNYTWSNVAEGFHDNQWWVWPYNQQPIVNQQDMFTPKLVTDNKLLEYKCSTYTSDDTITVDNVQKLGLLVCRLKIGDKYLCEDYAYSGMNSNWRIPSSMYGQAYTWKTAEEAAQAGLDTTFIIGIDPAIGDFIIGKELSISDTVDITMNIDAKGFAIPIPYSVGLTGEVDFSILGPYNCIWGTSQIVKHGANWYESYTTSQDEKYILSQIENIFVSDLEFKLYSDNGGKTQQNADNDLVYFSYENNTYTDEEGFNCKFCTSLTTDEVNALGVGYNLNNSSILNSSNNLPWTGMTYNGTNNVKLEEARVAEQYDIWKIPRNLIETSLKIDLPSVCYYSRPMEFPYVTGTYQTTEREIDLRLGKMKCKMKDFSQKINQ